MLWRYIFIPWINGERNIKWILYSLELDIDQVKARIASMFVYHYHGVIINPNKVYSMGDERLSNDEYELIKSVEKDYLVELFSKIEFIEDKNSSNPTGIFKRCIYYATENGTEIKEKYKTLSDNDTVVEKEKVVGYIPNNPDEKIFVIIDTLGLMKRERGFSKKDNIDKWVDDYAITLRNIYGFTIINLHHLNRGISSVERRKFQAEDLQPELEDIKDTSALGESSDMVIALFNPSVYNNIIRHQGYNIEEFKGKYRSAHVIASRYTEFPINSGLLFNFNTGTWCELPKPDDKPALEIIKKLI